MVDTCALKGHNIMTLGSMYILYNYAYIYMSKYIYTYIYIYMYIHVSTYTHIYICMHTCTYIHRYVYPYTYTIKLHGDFGCFAVAASRVGLTYELPAKCLW